MQMFLKQPGVMDVSTVQCSVKREADGVLRSSETSVVKDLNSIRVLGDVGYDGVLNQMPVTGGYP